MSTTPVNASVADAPPAKAGSNKKLLIIIAAAVLVLALAGGGAFLLLKKKPAADDEGDEGTPAAAAHDSAPSKHEVAKGAPPVFVPLDPFTVNLADKEGERYLQVAVTLEIEDGHFGDQLRLYLPAIRNNILLVLAQKTSTELLTRDGKELLAKQILRESLRPLGIDVPDPTDDETRADDAPPKKKAKRKGAAAPAYPIRSVQFASFIIQ